MRHAKRFHQESVLKWMERAIRAEEALGRDEQRLQEALSENAALRERVRVLETQRAILAPNHDQLEPWPKDDLGYIVTDDLRPWPSLDPEHYSRRYGPLPIETDPDLPQGVIFIRYPDGKAMPIDEWIGRPIVRVQDDSDQQG